ncbi:MAG: hypothetical protein LUG18_12850 [Candidatus Azobacteroides sp.]|nr:hypothetical protein [Candidatus Azobacteroides sp.]
MQRGWKTNGEKQSTRISVLAFRNTYEKGDTDNFNIHSSVGKTTALLP